MIRSGFPGKLEQEGSMRVWLRIALAATVLGESATLAQQAEILTPENAIRDQYIVVLHDEEPSRAGMSVAVLARSMAAGRGGRVTRIYERVLKGFAVSMPAQAARALANDPRVRYIEQDSLMYALDTQTNATWGLDRIDQRDLPLSTMYTYDPTGANVHGYIIDTGISSTHTEFGGRVSAVGYTAINDGRGTNDCNGHGTHVAGTVGGAIYGVAKQVTLHAVRVLNCSGSGTTSGVIAGVDWVTNNHVKPAVANMSLGGGASTALDDAVRTSIAAGVTYSIAAGNSNVNACGSSPARVGEALTVGASTSSDSRASFSNYGSCVDLFAPGSSIRSAWYTSDTATNTISGTSMAAPHVAGVAALYLDADPSASPATVNAAVVDIATAGRLTSIGSGSPNRLLYSLFSSDPGDNPPVASFTFVCSELICDFDASGSTDDVGIASYSWEFGDGQTGSGQQTMHMYASGGTFTVRLTVTDTFGQSNSTTRSVTVSGGGGDPCTGCTRYAGSFSGPGDADYHPNGTYYYSGVSGTHRGWLIGPSGTDFDLYLQKWNGWWWTTVASSLSADSEEQIAYSGTAGYYRWRVNSYSGSGSYSLWLQTP
jgi:serine protease